MKNIKYGIIFKEGNNNFEWYYENFIDFKEGLKEVYNCWSCSIIKIIVHGKEDVNWYDWL